MRVKIYLFILLTYIPFLLSSQPTNKLLGDVAMPSAEALSGSKYGDIPISYFTGVPNVAVGLHTITEGSLKIPLSLSYHSSGVKVGELSSWVGSNWSLQLGMVNRTVMGIPDDISNGYYDNNGDLVAPNLNNGTGFTQVEQSAKGERDTEPDLFHATMPGYGNIKWIFDKNNKVIQLPKTDFKVLVERDESISTNGGRFLQFTIISPTGVKFIFGKLASDTGVNDGMEYTYYDNIQVNQIAPSGWYLREVRSQDDKDIISYHYASQKYNYKHLSSCSINYQFSNFSVSCGNGASIGINKRVVNNNIDGFRLDSIRCSVGAIKFIANTDREDVEQYMGQISKRLDRIEINDGAFCKAYDFHYSYPTSLSGNTTPENKRLRLDSLQEISCNGLEFKPPHKFEYFAGVLPDRYSKQIDHWGYFNGAMFNEDKLNIPPVSVLWQGSFFTPPSATADREPNLFFAKRGALQKIIYPTGGHSEFDFELNEVKELTTTGGGNLIIFGELSNCNSPFDPNCCLVSSQVDTMTFTTEQLNGATYKLTAYNFVETTTCSDPIDYMIQVTVKEYNQSTILGTVSFNSCADSTCSLIEPLTDLVTLTAGVKYEFTIQLTASTAMTGLAKGTFAIQNESQVTQSYESRDIGGLRIAEFRQHDADDSARDIVRTYDYSESENSTLSSGLLYQEPRYWGYQKDNTGGVQSLTFQATSVAPLTNSNGYTIGYRRVVENTNGSGKTEYIFNAEAVVPTSFDEFPYTPDKLRAYDGVELRTTKLNTAGDSVAINKPFRYSGVGYEQLSGHIIYRAYKNVVNGNVLLYGKSYDIRTGVYLQGEQHSTLDGVTTITKFDYDPTNHLAPTMISMTNSDGIEYITENSYIFDFPSGDPVYTEMESRNMIRPVIESREKIKKNGVTTQIGGRRTTYSPYSKTTGTLAGSCCNGADPYVNNVEDYEMTWNANGNVVLGDADGWILEVIYDKYDLNTGQPTRIIPIGWAVQEYTWDAINKQRTSSKFIDFETKINYYLGSSLISSITEIDGQLDSLEWDDLMRPHRLLDRAENVISAYQYGYKGNGDGENFFKLTMDFTPIANSDLNQIQNISYKDGLNRVIQQITTKHSPNTLDVVVAQEYDNQGRVFKTYEPVESTNNDGSFFTIPTDTSHTLTTFEASPLHRTASITPPSWHISTTEYGTNTASIRDHYNTFLFSSNELNTHTITDPDGNQTIRFSDKKGRTVLTRRDSVNSNKNNDTYTAFDPKNRKVLVLPPGTELYPFPTYPDLVYTYLYDHLDQVIEQKIPGKEKIETIYEPNRDYSVAWRGGNLRTDGKWMVTTYDDYGRDIQTGLISSASTPNPINLLPTEIWTKTFWDGEVDASTFTGFINLQIPLEFQEVIDETQESLVPTDNSNNPIYKGKVHYTESAILTGNTASTNRLFSINRYETHGRIDRVQTDNHLGGFDNRFLSYDYSDNQTREIRFHGQKTSSTDFVTDTKDFFDHQGRIIKNTHLITGIGVFNNEICSLEYDVKDLVKTKKIGGDGSGGFLQEINYEYLPNRFLKGINTTLAADDLFSLTINYDQDIAGLTTGKKNGNIASLTWQVQGDTPKRYGFVYDYLDRLTAAKYDNPTNDYGTSYGYDNRGNILNTTRNGMYNDGSNYQSQQIDNMTLDYYSNSNRLKTVTDAVPCPNNKVIHQALDNTEMHAVGQVIEADNTVNDGANITYQAGDSIILKAGFHAKAGTDFLAKIDVCPMSGYETGGFVQRSTNDYLYDNNGNQTRDPHKGISIDFNYLNLPFKVTWDNGNTIEWLRGSSGQKFQQLTKRNGIKIGKLDYFGDNFEYQNDTLDRIYLKDAKVDFDKGIFSSYQFFGKDHLMSTRVVFEDGGSGIASLISEAHTYPFGMQFDGDFTVDHKVKRLYNFKEQVSDFGLDWSDFGERYYLGDGGIPRFLSVDPISDYFPSLSGYNYASNSPIVNIDLHGLQSSNINTGETKSIYEVKGSGYVEVTVGGGLNGRNSLPSIYDPLFPLPSSGFVPIKSTTANLIALDVIQLADMVSDLNPGKGVIKALLKGKFKKAFKLLFAKDKDKDKGAADSSKNEKHGDGGRAKSRIEKQIEKLEGQLEGANKNERKKINKKIENIKKDAAKKKKGEEHSRKKKR